MLQPANPGIAKYAAAAYAGMTAAQVTDTLRLVYERLGFTHYRSKPMPVEDGGPPDPPVVIMGQRLPDA